MKSIAALAAAAAFLLPFAVQAEEVTTGAWTTDQWVSSNGRPMCSMGTSNARGEVFFVTISSRTTDAHILVGRIGAWTMPQRFNANIMVDGYNHWSVGFRQVNTTDSAGHGFADREATIKLLKELALGNRMTVTFETGHTSELSLHGSHAAVMRFANCVDALEGRNRPPRAPVPPPAAQPRAPLPPQAGGNVDTDV